MNSHQPVSKEIRKQVQHLNIVHYVLEETKDVFKKDGK